MALLWLRGGYSPSTKDSKENVIFPYIWYVLDHKKISVNDRKIIKQVWLLKPKGVRGGVVEEAGAPDFAKQEAFVIVFLFFYFLSFAALFLTKTTKCRINKPNNTAGITTE